MQQHRGAYAHRGAAHGGHDRLGGALQRGHELEHRAVLALRRLLQEIFQIVAGGENVGQAGKQDDPHRLVGFGCQQRVGHALVHGAGNGVLLLRAVEADGADAACLFDADFHVVS